MEQDRFDNQLPLEGQPSMARELAVNIGISLAREALRQVDRRLDGFKSSLLGESTPQQNETSVRDRGLMFLASGLEGTSNVLRSRFSGR